jgi:hypothetical protein
VAFRAILHRIVFAAQMPDAADIFGVARPLLIIVPLAL